MPNKIKYVNLNDFSNIDRNLKYHWEKADVSALEKSISELGLLEPLLIYNGGKKVLLDGHKRLTFLENQHTPHPIPIIEYEGNLEEIYLNIVEKNNNEQELNLIEKAAILSTLERYIPDYNALRWQKSLSISMNKKYLTLYAWLLQIPSEWQHFFIEKRVPLRRIMNFHKAADINIYTTFIGLGISLSKLENLIELTREISRKSDQAEQEILNNCKDLVNSEKPQIIIDEIFEALYALRNPILSDYKQKVQQQISQMSLGRNLTLSVDLSMETPGFKGQFSVEKESDLDEFLEIVSTNKEKLKELLKREF